MKKLLCIVAITAFLIASCNTAEKRAAQARQEAEIRKIDSLVSEMDSLKSDIDHSVQEIDELLNDL